MSDDDEIVYVKKQKVTHYGSLEETMENRMRNEIENSTPIQSSVSTKIPEYFDIDLEM